MIIDKELSSPLYFTKFEKQVYKGLRKIAKQKKEKSGLFYVNKKAYPSYRINLTSFEEIIDADNNKIKEVLYGKAFRRPFNIFFRDDNDDQLIFAIDRPLITGIAVFDDIVSIELHPLFTFDTDWLESDKDIIWDCINDKGAIKIKPLQTINFKDI